MDMGCEIPGPPYFAQSPSILLSSPMVRLDSASRSRLAAKRSLGCGGRLFKTLFQLPGLQGHHSIVPQHVGERIKKLTLRGMTSERGMRLHLSRVGGGTRESMLAVIWEKRGDMSADVESTRDGWDGTIDQALVDKHDQVHCGWT
jgi:hypothetical protein